MFAGSLGAATQVCRPAAFRPSSAAFPRPGSGAPLRVTAGIGDAIKDLFDFESWAPRSSQAWRLGQQPSVRGGASASERITEDDVAVLNNRLASARSSAAENRTAAAEEAEEEANSRGDAAEQPSFLRSTDDDLSSALNERICQVSSGSGPREGVGEPLTGQTLRQLIYEKFGKQHDCSFVRRDIPGKTIVSLNIYHAHVGQRSFPIPLEEWEEKMDGVAQLLEAWGQAGRVVAFMKEPVAPRRGLPSRPIVGNAVSVTLELTTDQIEEWFGR